MDYLSFVHFCNNSSTSTSSTITLSLFPISSILNPPSQTSDPSLVNNPITEQDKQILRDWTDREDGLDLQRKVAEALKELWVYEVSRLPRNVTKVEVEVQGGWFAEMEGDVIRALQLARPGVELVEIEERDSEEDEGDEYGKVKT